MVFGLNREKTPGGKTESCVLVTVSMVAVLAFLVPPADAIDVKVTMEEAKKTLESGRTPMEKASSAEAVKEIMQQASVMTRVGADPIKDPCGPMAILRTKRFWLEAFGRKEAVESKKQKKSIRMPDARIQRLLDTPNLEVEIQLCGDDEYFAEGAEVVFQQKSKNIKPVDVSPAQKGRKNEGDGSAYRSRFTARFSYDSFDPMGKIKLVIFFPDGKLMEIPADLSKIK